MNVIPRPRAALAAGLWIATLAAQAQPAEAPKFDPVRAIAVLTKHCAGCHSGKAPRAQLDITNRKKLVERKLVQLGNPDASELLLMVESGQMPPGTRPKPDEDERRLLRDWIKSRMPEPPPPPPKYGEEYLLKLIADDWKAVLPAKQPKVRYLSLNHLLATEAGQKRLPKARAELIRILGALVGPRAPGLDLKPLDKAESAFRLDLESIGWDARPLSTVTTVDEKEKFAPMEMDLFDLVLLEYPYGVLPLKNKAWPAVVPMVRATKAIRPVPYVRGDWLAAAVTDPALGRELLLLLGKEGDAPAPVAADVWPAAVDSDEYLLELGWEADKAGLLKALADVGLRESGGVRRAEWERYWPNVIRRLDRGIPVFPLDQGRRDTYSSDPKHTLKGQTIDFVTKKPKAKFYSSTKDAEKYDGDLMALELEVSSDSTVELTVFDHKLKYAWPPYVPPQQVPGGKPFYEDYKEKGKGVGYEVDATPAKEAWVMIAVSREGGKVQLAEGVAVVAQSHRETVRSRYVHRNLYELDGAGTGLKEPIDRAARSFAHFETLGPRPKAPVKPKKK